MGISLSKQAFVLFISLAMLSPVWAADNSSQPKYQLNKRQMEAVKKGSTQSNTSVKQVKPSAGNQAEVVRFYGVKNITKIPELAQKFAPKVIQDVWVGFWGSSVRFGKSKSGTNYLSYEHTGAIVSNLGAKPAKVQCIFLDSNGNLLRQGLAYVIYSTSLGTGQRWACVPPKNVVHSQNQNSMNQLNDHFGTVIVVSDQRIFPTGLGLDIFETEARTRGLRHRPPAQHFYQVDCSKPEFGFVCNHATPSPSPQEYEVK